MSLSESSRLGFAEDEWEFDYTALHSQANTIKRLAGRTQGKEAPSLPLSPCSCWRLSFPSSPVPHLPGWKDYLGASQTPGAQPALKDEDIGDLKDEDRREPQPAPPDLRGLPLPSPQQALTALPSALPVPSPKLLYYLHYKASPSVLLLSVRYI